VWIEILIPEQTLTVHGDGDAPLLQCRIASARNGVGERIHSECTPRGWHLIRAKIGAGCPENTVFVGRRPTGERYSPALRFRYPERDWILTRILWLSGCEPGRNRLGDVDTMRRYVYIHGAPDEDPMGIPSSHGCIKMRNADVVRLFDLVPAGTRVYIGEEKP
jgi:L,D-transpeptidase YbiS